MTISPDYLLERRRNKGNLLKWKLMALSLTFAASWLFFATFGSSAVESIAPAPTSSKYVALIEIDDVIYEDYKKAERIANIADDDNAKALMVYINSPGGSVTGSEMLYNAIREVSQKKPVVAVMGTIATSGGYMAAIAADYIVAYNSTLTGSIGVIMQSVDATELGENIGLNFENFKSGRFKAMPNPAEKTTPEVRAVVMESIQSSHDFFAGLVAKRRKLNTIELNYVTDGKAFTGTQALELKLVDALGDRKTARDWLSEKHKIDKELDLKKIRLRKPPSFQEILLEEMEGFASNLFFGRRLKDGLYSIYR